MLRLTSRDTVLPQVWSTPACVPRKELDAERCSNEPREKKAKTKLLSGCQEVLAGRERSF